MTSLKQAASAAVKTTIGYSSSGDEACCSSGAAATRRQRDDKHCAVCGDHAVGYNFGAVACESCKAFFRRNALRMSMPQCLFTGVCTIQVKTRRFCSPCRLKKCLEVGMRKSCIMDEKAKRERREKILRNRERKEACQSNRPITHSPNHTAGGGDEMGCTSVYGNDYIHYPASRATDYGETTSLVSGTSFPLLAHRQPLPAPLPVYSIAQTPSGTDHRSQAASSGTWHPWHLQQDDLHQHHASENPSNAIRGHHRNHSILAGLNSSDGLSSLTDNPQTDFIVYDSSTNKENGGGSGVKLSTSGNNSWTVTNPTHSENPSSPLPSLSDTGLATRPTLFPASSVIRLAFNRNESGATKGAARSTPGFDPLYTRVANFPNRTTVTNVLDGHVWTSEPEEPSNKECISLCPNLLDTGMARLLSKDQWTALNDLRSAYEISFRDSEADHTPESSSNVTLSNLVNTSSFLVRKFINFAKKLADFSVLGQEGQICLLKGVVLNALFIRSASHYDVLKDVWITPKGEIPTCILKIATGLEVLYKEHAKYCSNFCEVVKKDLHLVSLMQVLCLFTPDRPGLADRQSVSNIYDRYILLLKHYLEARHGFAIGRTHLAAVLTNLAELQALTDNYGHIILHVDPNKVDPLILEVFNLTRDIPHKESVEEGNKDPNVTLTKNNSESAELDFQCPPPPHSSKAWCTAEAH